MQETIFFCLVVSQRGRGQVGRMKRKTADKMVPATCRRDRFTGSGGGKLISSQGPIRFSFREILHFHFSLEKRALWWGEGL